MISCATSAHIAVSSCSSSADVKLPWVHQLLAYTVVQPISSRFQILSGGIGVNRLQMSSLLLFILLKNISTLLLILVELVKMIGYGLHIDKTSLQKTTHPFFT